MQSSQLSELADSGARMFEEQPLLEESFTIHLGRTYNMPSKSGLCQTKAAVNYSLMWNHVLKKVYLCSILIHPLFLHVLSV